MVNEEADLVERKPAEKKSLLERYDIPVDHLSYEYITQCISGKELERIVIILRSGEEGSYPDLTKHAEKRLAVVKPESAVLRIAEPVLKRNMLEPDKRRRLENDINEWMDEMKLREKDLEEGRTMQTNETIIQPAIRRIKFDEPEKNKQQSSRCQKTHKRIGACDYAGWDKYDADTEFNRIDLQHEQKQAEAKRAQKKLRDKEAQMKKASREDLVNKLTLTGTELSVMSEKEREKGNEAFKAGDYEEALHFYNSSIAIDATLNAYNNRAITYIKLQRYNDAINDCNKVLNMDYTNIKALLRRGFALDRLEKRTQALADYEAVLKLDPSNKTAITALNKLRGPCDSKKIRMKIENGPEKNEVLTEISSKKKAVEDNSPAVQSKNERIKSKIISHESNAPRSLQNSSKNTFDSKPNSQKTESFVDFMPDQIDSTSILQMRSQICFCDNAPTSSKYSSPQPHYRDIYCPKATHNYPKFPKPQSIFTDTKIPFGKSSGVIIEEIPNETCEKSMKMHKSRQISDKSGKCQDAILTNFGIGDNVMITEKSPRRFIEELSSKKYDSKVQAKNETKADIICSKMPDKSDDFSKPRNADMKDLSAKACGVIVKDTWNEACAKPVVMVASEKAEERPTILRETETIMKNFETLDNEVIAVRSGIFVEKFSGEKYQEKIDQRTDTKIDGSCSKNRKKSMIIKKPICEDVKEFSEKFSGLVVKEERDEPSDELEKKTISRVSDDKPEKLLANLSDESSKVDGTGEKKIEPIDSPYEFLCLWYSIRNDHDLTFHTYLLRALPPEKIDAVIGNQLDGEMFSMILRCFEQHFCTPEDSKLLLRFLQYLGRVRRFSIMRMFMDGMDIKVLQNLFSFLEGQGYPDIIRDLRKLYDMPV